MSETLSNDLSRAENFKAKHIHLQSDYETYAKETLSKWRKEAEEALKEKRTVRPLWLRRTDEMGSEFGAVIDYVIPGFPWEEKALIFASIDIDGTGGHSDISLILPKQDGSGEPIRVITEAYTMPALQRAIEYAEASV